MSFPDIPGVTFKAIKKEGFDDYAVSSDSRVWISKGGNWRPMQSYKLQDGRLAVWLRNNSSPAGYAVLRISDLYEEYFGDQRSCRQIQKEKSA